MVKLDKKYKNAVNAIIAFERSAHHRAKAFEMILPSFAHTHDYAMIDSRNKVVHIYKEEIAHIVFKSIESHARLMRYCIDTFKP